MAAHRIRIPRSERSLYGETYPNAVKQQLLALVENGLVPEALLPIPASTACQSAIVWLSEAQEKQLGEQALRAGIDSLTVFAAAWLSATNQVLLLQPEREQGSPAASSHAWPSSASRERLCCGTATAASALGWWSVCVVSPSETSRRGLFRRLRRTCRGAYGVGRSARCTGLTRRGESTAAAVRSWAFCQGLGARSSPRSLRVRRSDL